jgi:hypothetical protein
MGHLFVVSCNNTKIFFCKIFLFTCNKPRSWPSPVDSWRRDLPSTRPSSLFLPENDETIVKNLTLTQCCGSGMFIPDPNFFHPGSRVKKIPDPAPQPHQKFKYFNTKKLFLSSRKYDLGCSSRIRIFYPFRIPGPKSHRITDPDPQHCLTNKFTFPFKQNIALKCCLVTFSRIYVGQNNGTFSQQLSRNCLSIRNGWE